MRYLFIFYLIIFCGGASGQQQIQATRFSIPKPEGLVSDFESSFSGDQKNKIISKLDSVNKLGKVEIGLAIFDSTYVKITE